MQLNPVESNTERKGDQEGVSKEEEAWLRMALQTQCVFNPALWIEYISMSYGNR